MIDFVTVYHNDRNHQQALELQEALGVGDAFHIVDNQTLNRGFAGGCNIGALQGSRPIIGFVNPDCAVSGDVSTPVIEAFQEMDPPVIAGENFGKPQHEYYSWGCRQWVCGAAFFVCRDWFEKVGGFDERYLWGWEETDLIRRAQLHGLRVQPLSLPIHHASPDWDTPQDSEYKRVNFQRGAELFRFKWNPRSIRPKHVMGYLPRVGL